ncbi:TlpA family protein disulfide reductase [Rubritalea squalenifaciens]|nr:TlpA disulfide reductase family protein [Rubritalea squalenifaciens]
MNSRILRSLISILSCFCLVTASTLTAAPHTLSEWSFGEVVHGETFTKESLKGKVVVVDYWGTHCPPCLALIPHLVKLDDKYRDKGLKIIAPESQGSSKDAITRLMKKHQAQYTVTAGCSGPLQLRGLPHAVVFNAQGQIVFSGHPADSAFDRSIKNALKESRSANYSRDAISSNQPLIGHRTWTNQDGQKIKATLLAVENGKAKFRLTNGSVTLYDITKLSLFDKELIQDALKD